MPPASPVPGWSRGEVCREIIARRRTADRSAAAAAAAYSSDSTQTPPSAPTTRPGRPFPGRGTPDDTGSPVAGGYLVTDRAERGDRRLGRRATMMARPL